MMAISVAVCLLFGALLAFVNVLVQSHQTRSLWVSIWVEVDLRRR